MSYRIAINFLVSFIILIGIGILIGYNIKPATMVITNTPILETIGNLDGIPTAEDTQTSEGLSFTTIHYYPQLVYLYGIPYWEFQMPNTPYYTLAPELMPMTEVNIEAGYAVKTVNGDGNTIVEIPVSPNTINVSRTFGK